MPRIPFKKIEQIYNYIKTNSPVSYKTMLRIYPESVYAIPTLIAAGELSEEDIKLAHDEEEGILEDRAIEYLEKG